MRSLVNSARLISEAPQRAARKEALRYGTGLFLILVLGLGAFGWTTWQQAESQAEFRQFVYDGCMLRRDNDVKTQNLWLKLARSAPTEQVRAAYAAAADGITLRDCSIYLDK